MRCSQVSAFLTFVVLALQSSLDATSVPAQLKLVTAAGYLPQVPFLVRVEALDAQGLPDRAWWNAAVTLSTDQPGITFSTNALTLRNGRGSALVVVGGSGDFTLKAESGSVTASRAIQDRSGETVTTAGGALAGSETTWSGVIRVTSDVTVPAGHTLTLLSNTLVMLDGVASGTTANDLLVRGNVQSLGTEAHPVTFTCAQPELRWGQIRHTNAGPSLYRHTIITRAGRGRAEGHTGTTPVIRPFNSTLVFEECSLTDFAEVVTGTPGKVAQASGSDLTFVNCLFQRARMGPEINGTALACTNTWILDMNGPDDADGIYLHDQSAGQQVTLSGCVLALGGDDGIDTLGSVITVEKCIVRDWNSVIEDAKGISVFSGETHIRDSLIVDCTVGVSAKTTAGAKVLVTMNHCTVAGNLTNVLAQYKSSAPGPVVDYRITNSVLWASPVSVQSDFAETNLTIRFSAISQPWPGEGNTESDPMFVDASAHDYRLLPYSPAIDSGAPTSPADPDGSPADRGAFPFIPARPELLGATFSSPNGFQFFLHAYTNRSYVIESSPDSAAWTLLKTVTQSAETNLVADTSAPGVPHRFYRARLAP